MRKLNIHQAKTHFSKLVEAALQGEEIIIAKAGKPILKLVLISKDKPKRHFGALKGKVKIAEDFDVPLNEEVISEFETA